MNISSIQWRFYASLASAIIAVAVYIGLLIERAADPVLYLGWLGLFFCALSIIISSRSLIGLKFGQVYEEIRIGRYRMGWFEKLYGMIGVGCVFIAVYHRWVG